MYMVYCVVGKYYPAILPYSGSLAGEKFGEFGAWFVKLKLSKLVRTINNLLADPFIGQTFFHQMLEKSQFAKLSLYVVYDMNKYSCALKSLLKGFYIYLPPLSDPRSTNEYSYHIHRMFVVW